MKPDILVHLDVLQQVNPNGTVDGETFYAVQSSLDLPP